MRATILLLQSAIAVAVVILVALSAHNSDNKQKQQVRAGRWSINHWQMRPTTARLRVPPVYVDKTDLVVFIDSNATITCVNTTAKAVQWSRGTGDLNFAGDGVQLLAYNGEQPTVFVNLRGNSSDGVFVNDTGVLIALDAATGEEQWARDVPNRQMVVATDSNGVAVLAGASIIKSKVELLALSVADGSVTGHWHVGFARASSVAVEAAGGGVVVAIPHGASWLVELPSGAVAFQTRMPLYATDTNFVITAEQPAVLSDIWDVSIITVNNVNKFRAYGTLFVPSFTQPMTQSSGSIMLYTDRMRYVTGQQMPPKVPGFGKWSVNLAGSTEVWPCKSAVVLAHDIDDAFNLTGVDATTGATLWNGVMNVDVGAGIHAVGDMLFFTNSGSKTEIIALNARDGTRHVSYGGYLAAAVGQGLSGAYAFVESDAGLQLRGYTMAGSSSGKSIRRR